MKLEVYLNTFGNRQLLGLLVSEGHRIFFEYAPDFLKTKMQLSPFYLPLKSGVFESKTRLFDGLFGLFNDSLPDGWGCLLLDRKLQEQGLSYQSISPLDRLALIGSNPMGALEYEPTQGLDLPFFHVQLDSLSSEADKILNGLPAPILDQLQSLNGSAGGARPKIIAQVSKDKKTLIHGPINSPSQDFDPWLIKFSNKSDRRDLGVKEFVYSLIAKKAGIDMPETYLFPSLSTPGHFGVKRFDRVNGQKIHIHTVCGLINADYRVPCIDYTNLLKLTHILTKDMREVEKMTRLMIFNVLAQNKDDHSKNFAFMLNEQNQWRLTPAYDLTPSQGINGEQTCLVNGKGKNITTEDFLAVATPFNISSKKVMEIIEQVQDSLAEYPKLIHEWRG